MPTRKRIVLYPAAGQAADEALVDFIVEATGLDRAALAAQLAKAPAVYLPELESEAAAGLVAALEVREADFDVDSYPPSAEQVAWLEGEIPKWVKRGFVPPHGQAGLYWNYGLAAPAAPPASPPARAETSGSDPGFLVKAVLTIGSILVGLGLILFVASNWQRIPVPAKIGGGLVLSLAALHLGYRLRFVRGPYPRLSATFFLIALFGIGGVLALIAQVYHLTAGTYLVPLAWGALCLPVAFLLRFQTALYFASALWLWSYWLYPTDHERLPWYYAVLLLGFLLPYAIAVGDRFLYWAHVALVVVALISTLGTEDFWLATVWVVALCALAAHDRRPAFDWILTIGFFFWAVAFLQYSDDTPNAFYLLPLAYFFHRARERRDEAFLVVSVANALFWWLIFVLQIMERFDLGEPSPTGVLLWALGTGVLVYGGGTRLARHDWSIASVLLRLAGSAIALAVVYAMSFRFYENEREFFSSPLLLFVSLASLAVGAVLLFLPGGVASKPRRDELFALGLLALALILAAAFSPALGLHVLLFNLILFAAAFLLMLEGHRDQSLVWYNLGIGLFVVLIVSRYFDTFVDLLPRSVFFVLGGVFLIVWAVLADRQRRRRAAAASGGSDDA